MSLSALVIWSKKYKKIKTKKYDQSQTQSFQKNILNKKITKQKHKDLQQGYKYIRGNNMKHPNWAINE